MLLQDFYLKLTKVTMLYFREDKHSTRPLQEILTGVEYFMELCEPESQIPIYIGIDQGDRLWDIENRHKYKVHHQSFIVEGYTEKGFIQRYCGENLTTNLTAQQMIEKLHSLSDLANNPNFAVDVRWFPLVKQPTKISFPLFYVYPVLKCLLWALVVSWER